MEDQEKEKEEIFNKAISYFNENLYNMSLFYLPLSKTLNNEDIVEEYIKKSKEHIKEQHSPENQKHFLNPKDKMDYDSTINRITNSENNYETLGLSNSANKDQVIEAYKKLIISFHPDVNLSPNADEIFKKISKSYSHIMRIKEPNAYKLLEQSFKDEDLVEIINNEKTNLELKQLTISPIFKFINFVFRGSIYFFIFIYFILPYFYTFSSSNIYEFTLSVSNPYEKTSKRLKVKYYIGNEFKEKYVTNSDIRNIEKEIEFNYLDYLNKTCEETKETKEKFTKRLIYYKKGTINYNSIISDIAKVDLSVCDKYEKYNKKYESMKLKLKKMESNNEDEEETEEEQEKEKEKEKEKE